MTASVPEALEALRTVLTGLPFDEAIFFEHAFDDAEGHHRRLACPRFVLKREGWGRPWSQRWQPELEEGAAWLRGPTPWTDDLEDVVRRNEPVADTRPGEIPGVRELRAGAMRALLGFPIVADDQVGASLLLVSTEPSVYGAPERDRLHTEAVAAAMRELLGALKRQRRRLIEDLRRSKFVPGASPEAIAKGIAAELAQANDWDFVGIYRVGSDFAMIASDDRTPGQTLKIDPAFRQPLDVGMLGETLRLRRCLRADDVEEIDPDTGRPPHNYSKVDGFEARSALTYPIFIGSKIAWVLDCASIATAAFHGPDREVLVDLVRELQSTLDLWFEMRLSMAILDGLSEPVLVVNEEGRIERVNRAAKELLQGLEQGTLPMPFAELAADDETRRKLARPTALANEGVVLAGRAGQPLHLLATAVRSDGAFGKFVVKLASKAEKHWIAGLDIARRTVEADANQARVFLMLASALVGRARNDLREPGQADRADDGLRRAAEAIEHADMGYEKVVEALAGRSRLEAGEPVLDTLVSLAVGEATATSLPSGAEGAGPRDDVTLTQALKTVVEYVASVATSRRPEGLGAPADAGRKP